LCDEAGMSRTITQRELRNESGAIMRGLDRGETFIVTRRGVPVGELIPIRRHRFASRADVARVFAGAAPIDRERFTRDLDRHVRQDAEPRG
jgi:antitoxin (DNA-binding transcriptional repressor) of toxin-antitoxin stability system